MENTILTDAFFEQNGFVLNDGYWCVSQYDCNYCFKYADFRDDWGFYQEYTDSPFPHDEGKKHFISCGLTTEGHIKALIDILYLSAFSSEDIPIIKYTGDA